MNRHVRIIVLIPLCTAFVCLAGCKSTGTPNETGSTENRLMIVENGSTVYTIVRPDEGSGAETDAAVKLKKSIGMVTGADIGITTDRDIKNDSSARFEILVGDTNRGESTQVLEALTENQFAIKVINGCVVIAGGSDNALTDAVDYFLKEYLGYMSDKNYTAKTGFGISTALDVLSVIDTSKKIALFITDQSAGYADAVKTGISNAFTRVTEYTAGDSLSDIFSNKNDLVVIAGANKVPAGTISAVNSYMSNGGKVLTVGGPTFENILYPLGGSWVTEQEYLISCAENSATKKEIINLSSEKAVKRLSRSTNDSSESLIEKTGDFGLEGSGGQLMVTIPNLTSWDVLNTGFSVPDGNNAIGFRAKGDSMTPGLYVEIFEKDGSRWYAVAPLKKEWQYFILTSSDFTVYASPSRAGTSVDISNGQNIQFGLAMSGQSVSSGEHTYYIAGLCTLSYMPADGKTSGGSAYSIDGMTPGYELYPITGGTSVAACDNQVYVSDTAYTLPYDLFSCSPGRRATGCGKGRVSRFIPLIEVFDKKGLRSGYAAWMYVFLSGTGTGSPVGSMYTTFSVNDASFYDPAGMKAVCDAMKSMLSGAFLVEGGTDEYIYVAQDTSKITAGALVAIGLSEESTVKAKVTLYSGDTVLAEKTDTAGGSQLSQTEPGGYYKMEFDYKISAALPDRVVTEMYVGGVLRDRLEHKVSFWVPEKDRKYIYTGNGCFMRDGEILNLFGVNYMPSSGIAENDGPLFEYYVSAASYDPDVFYNDLLRVKDIGFNCISVFVYYDSIKDCNNILHLINMCEELGLYVDLSLRPGAYPFSYNAKQVETMITRLHFAENDNIIAYDIAWEPMLGSYESGTIRKSLDGGWNNWILDQYGSLSAAETAWGVSAPRDSIGNVIGATDAMLDSASGTKYDKIVAAYRRFIDDAVAYQFNITCQHMISLDPNHLISFRMSMAGSPGVAPSTYCYDFRSIASTIGFMSPEGYALSASGDSAYQALFANVYARYTNPGKPVVWKEYGKSAWTGSNFGNNSGSLEAQKSYYEAVLAEYYKAYTSALYCWFFPGGYRCGENSDYGIINPDGSDRPATATLRKYAGLFKSQGAREESNYFIEIERDDYSGGITGMYDEIKDELIQAFGDGYSVSLVSKLQKDGIIYADESLDYAVGGAKAGVYPLRYVNGQVMKTENVTNGGKKYLRVKVTNTHDASWRAGTVSLVSVSGVKLEFTFTEDIAYLGSVTADIPVSGSGKTELKLCVNGVLFGMKYTAEVK